MEAEETPDGSITPPSLDSSLDHVTIQAVQEVSPELFTIATLTGHAIRAMGPNYSVRASPQQTWALKMHISLLIFILVLFLFFSFYT